jgi:hypothetical protein
MSRAPDSSGHGEYSISRRLDCRRPYLHGVVSVPKKRRAGAFQVSGLGASHRVLATSKAKQQQNTYNSGYSLVVTHLTTNPPVRRLNRAERTGSLVVTCSNTTETAKLSMYGIAQLVTRLSRNEKDLLALTPSG